MKCRARMIDGSPVTFEWGPELTVERDGHPYVRRECFGEGFLVAAEAYAYHGGAVTRDRSMRKALEDAGVDTATVEYAEVHGNGRFVHGVAAGTILKWRPLFPPVVKPPILHTPPLDANFDLPGRITYVRTENELTRDMVHAGGAKLHDILHENAAIFEGKFFLRCGLGDAVETLWRAMEKARTK